MENDARRRASIARVALTARAHALAALSLTAVAACSGADPPYEQLPLRDALTADPEVLAAMTDQARHELGERLEAARRAEEGAEPVPEPGEEGAPASLISAVDAARAARGADALVAARVGGGAAARTVEPLSLEVRREAPEPPGALPPLAGGDLASTAYLEQQALAGHAGAVLDELRRASGARRLVRVTAWPVGAAAVGDVIYVNASWLVALSPAGAGNAGAVGPAPGRVGPAPRLAGNPYLTYGSLAACVSDVTTRCATCLSSGQCDAQPTLTDFPDARSECTFLAADASRPSELCALALLSIGAVGECVRDADASCSVPSATATSAALTLAATFVADAACTQALDQCLSGSPTGSTSTSTVHVSGASCQDPFSACASAFDGLDDACKSGSCTGNGQSCTACSSCKSTEGNSGCSSCNSGGSTTTSSSSNSCSSCDSGGSAGSSSSNACKCQTPAAPVAPLGSLAWLCAPLGYALLRGRRPS